MTPAPCSWATLGEQFHHLPAAMTVEGGGRFVGQDDARLVGQCAGDGHALLLSAREHRRQVVGPVANAEIVHQFERAALRGAT